jgi:uncharacterized membrane protein YkoI
LRRMERFVLGVLLIGQAMIADQKVKLENVPPAVQKAVREQAEKGTLVGLSTEKEKGKTMYEVETKVNGKSRDVLLDKGGAVVEIEEEVELSSIPAPARAAIEKRAAGGTINKVELVTHGPTVVYEAEIRTKAGKNVEVGVKADGSLHK